MRLSPFNVFTVFVAGAVWVLMFGYWILFCIHVYPWVHAVAHLIP